MLLSLQSTLNRYSIIGSLVYGLVCVLPTASEINSPIELIARFLCAALFYFVMYLLYVEYKATFRYLWAHKIRTVCVIVVGWAITVNLATIAYMLQFHVSYEIANEAIAQYVGIFFYNIPFLP